MARLSFPPMFLWTIYSPLAALVQASGPDPLAACPGYVASNVQHGASGLTANLTLAGAACDVFGEDLKDLILVVACESGELGEIFV